MTDAAISTIADWLARRLTPICWVLGPPGCGKTAAASAILRLTEPAHLLPLSAASPDRCLWQLLNQRTTAGLFATLTTEATRLLVLDALDTLQYRVDGENGRVFDARLRHLLSEAARGAWPALSTIVTSRFRPPPDLPDDRVTIVEIGPAPPTIDNALWSRKDSATAILEALASSRKASSGWLLGLLTGHNESRTSLATPAAVRAILDRALGDGLVHRVDLGRSGDWIQMPDEGRRRFLPSHRAMEAHRSFAAVLESDGLSRYVELAAGADPELRHDLEERAIVHRLEAGDMDGAVAGYWQRLGNYSRLRHENAMHLGVRVSCTLNLLRPPTEVAHPLKASAGGLAVVNDWGVHAISVGDAGVAADAARAAYDLVSEDLRPWDKSMLACHAAEALLLRARLPEAMEWAEQARDHARAGARLMEGMPAREVISAYESAFYTIMRIAAAGNDRDGVARAFDELIDVLTRAREKLAEFNRSAVLPLDGPAGEVDPDALMEGRPASLAALVAGRPDDASRILTSEIARRTPEELSSPRGLEVRMALLRAQLAAERYREAHESIETLQSLAGELDDARARSELTSMAAGVALLEGRAGDALALADEGLILTSDYGLDIFGNGLLKTRARALLTLGRADESQAALEAIQQPAAAPPVTSSGFPHRRPAPAEMAADSEPDRRRQLHQAALAVIDDYNTRGLPFALYFRKFDFNVMHGPMEYGPRLTENVLRDAMPAGVNLLTIQSHSATLDYSGGAGTFNRSAPALLVDDADWQQVAMSLIPFADLIVSEAYMLGEGVRFELDTAFQAGRWDRTVLLLPPLKSYLAVIDNDPLIQLFPRGIWMDDFHTQSLTASPLVKDLIARMARVAALPDTERLRLADRAARDEAFPVDLRPIAEHYETEARWESQRQDEDDRVRYYGFWKLFRAASIRGHLVLAGDDGFANRSALSSVYVEMSGLMLDHEREGDTVVLVGDLTFAEQCAQSACGLIRDGDGPVALDFFREQAERQLQVVRSVRAAIEAEPARFVLRPRYGPFAVRAARRGGRL